MKAGRKGTIVMATALELSISSIFQQLLQGEQQTGPEQELVYNYAALSAMQSQ